jgi:hypothetical protein
MLIDAYYNILAAKVMMIFNFNSKPFKILKFKLELCLEYYKIGLKR